MTIAEPISTQLAQPNGRIYGSGEAWYYRDLDNKEKGPFPSFLWALDDLQDYTERAVSGTTK